MIKFIDFFAGIGGMRYGLEKAGLKCVGFCEWDKYARQSYKAMYNTEGEWENHDIRTANSSELPTADLWCFGFPCFAENTMILTDSGYKPIQDIAEGEHVLTHKGNWKKVIKVMQRDGAELWEVKGFGIPPTITTENHPYYVTKDGEIYEFVKVKDLTDAYNTTVIFPKEVDSVHSAAWWKLVGRYLADGWTVERKDGPRGGKVVIACNDKKSSLLEKIIEDAGYHFTLDKGKSCNKYIISNNELYYSLVEFGQYAYGKGLTFDALSLNKEKSKALLDGYMSGDGCKNEHRATSTSLALVLGLQMIASKSGYSYPSIYVCERPSTCVIEGRLVNQRTAYQFRYSDKGVKSFNGNNGYVCRKMDRPKNLHRTGRVYNISVEDDESYIANGAIVHNCQDISVAGKQKGILEGERSNLFFEIIRLLQELPKEARPKYLLAENVKNLLSIGRGWDFARLICALGEVGYDVEWQLFNTKYTYITGNIDGRTDGEISVVRGIPQNRERVFIIGRYVGERGRGKVFPIPRADSEDITKLQEITQGQAQFHRVYHENGVAPALETAITKMGRIAVEPELECIGSVGKMHQGTAIYNGEGLARTLQAECGGLGAKTGLYTVRTADDMTATPIGKMEGTHERSQRYKIYDKDGLAPTLCAGMGEGGNTQPFVIDDMYANRDARTYENECPTLRSERNGLKVAEIKTESDVQIIGNKNPCGHGNGGAVYDSSGVSPTICCGDKSYTYVTCQPVITPEREEKRQNGRRMKDDGEPMFTLTAQDRHGVAILKQERNEYGKEIRKEYESGELQEQRKNMTQFATRTDGISNTITTVTKDNYLMVKGNKDDNDTNNNES